MRDKLVKNANGEYRYLFNWKGGGFNSVWARNMKEFRKNVNHDFSGCKVEVDYSSVHKATVASSERWDRMGYLMTC